MREAGSINRAIFEEAEKALTPSTIVEEVRIGLGYAAVVLENGQLGLAAMLRNDFDAGCTLLKRAGTLAGDHPLNLLRLLVEGRNSLERALGLATANALFHGEVPAVEEDALDLAGLTQDDRVAMVGFFGPLVKKIEASGAVLSILELDPRRPGFRKESPDHILKTATVALITATTILNGTIEAVLDRVGRARHVCLLGPSTPLSPESFRGTPVNHLGGALCLNKEKILRIISEGGGTPVMRPWLSFVNLVRRREERD